jgi:hypothetical protein
VHAVVRCQLGRGLVGAPRHLPGAVEAAGGDA